MSPSTVSENGVVGQATSFDLTLDGKTPYTYTQTFGNICSVDINDNIATVTITPTETGTLTGSITFNEEATCNITIAVSEPTGYSLTPTTVSDSVPGGYTGTYTLTLDVGSDFDIANLFVDSTAFGAALLSKTTMSSAGTITLSYHADEFSEDLDMTDVFTVTATCHRKDGLPAIELSSTFNITVTKPEPEPPTPTVVTVTPDTVSENGVVGQATSFNLILSGDSTYTYTQTFGNICSVDINDNIATVTITPITSGTLTGSITFNEEATCNITIAVSEPTPPTGGFRPTSINESIPRAESSTCYFELLSGSYDSTTETADFSYTITNTSTEGDIRGALNINEDINNPPEYQLILESNNEGDETLTGVVNVYAKIYDDEMIELLRTYTATINVTLP